MEQLFFAFTRPATETKKKTFQLLKLPGNSCTDQIKVFQQLNVECDDGGIGDQCTTANGTTK